LAPHVGIVEACRLTGRSRATHHRWLNPAAPKPRQPRPVPASALSTAKRAAILALMDSPRYAELPPAQIWARELDEGRYSA
jgi:putative transposase